MLSKLFKTDLRSTARSFVPVCFGVLVLAAAMIVCMVMILSSEEVTSAAEASLIVAYVISFLALFVFSALAFIIPVQRFRRCVMKNDAYLMLTIPIRPSLHIASKLLCSVVWYIAAQICRAIVTAIMFFADKSDLIGFGELMSFFTLGRTKGEFDTDIILYILLSFFNTLLLIIMAQLFLYMVFVIASMSSKNSGVLTVLLAIGGSVLITWGYSLVFAMWMNFGSGDAFDYITSGMRFIPTLIYYAVLSIVFYFVTAYIMDHKYNLP